MFTTLEAMGFGKRFISYIRILYSNAESLVKVCGSLITPFPFEKGIRQGCPLLGLLYSISIEPFLHTLRRQVNQNGLRLPESNKFDVVTAYADDVTIFITSDDGFNTFNHVYDMFSRASAACLNYQKSQGLWAGSWVTRNDKTLNFNWNNQALTFLGVHLGNKNKDLAKLP